MKFGYFEIKEFAENHEDERVRIMYKRLCKVRSDNAKCTEVINKKDAEIKRLKEDWSRDIDINRTTG